MRAKGRLLTAAAISVALLLAVSAGAARTPVADPSFAPGPSFDAGVKPTDVAVADFSGDRKPDLAVANCFYGMDFEGNDVTRSDVRILIADGTGDFHRGPAPPLPFGEQTCSLASADFNGDGSADLAVAISSGTAVAILLGDGTGRFTAAAGSPVAVSGAPSSVAAADVNGDGRADLVVPVLHEPATGRVTGFDVLLGDGSGGFAEAPGSPVPILAGAGVSIAIADLDGDGKPDLALSNTERNEVSVLRGDGTGQFEPPASVASLRRPAKIGVGDFDGNGKPDLAVRVSGGVDLLLGDGSGSFQAAPGSPVLGAVVDLAVSDVNGDGRSDLITSPASSAVVSVYVAVGDGKVRRVALAPFPAEAGLLATADFDGDGRTDVAGLTGGAPYWPIGPPGSVVLLQTPSAPQIEPGRILRSRDTSFTTRKPIYGFSADGTRAGLCVGFVPIVWTASTRASLTFRRSSCYGDVAVAGDRVAWAQDVGCGNLSCAAGVFVAKLSGGRPREVDEQENDCGAGPCDPTGTWIAQLLGSGPLIAWNDWYVDCSADCDSGVDEIATFAITGQDLLRFYGGHARSVRRDHAARPLLAVGGGHMALHVGGRVVVLKPTGAQVASVPAPGLESVALSATELGVAGRTSLSLYNPANGHLRKTIALGPAAAFRLVGITTRLAVLRGVHSLVLVRLADGKLISFPLASKAAKRLVDAKLTKAGLFYVYNAARSSHRVVFEPTSRLLARF